MKKKILVISPHIDDGELGCGATIARFVREGNDIHYIAFSAAEENVREGFPKNQLRVELQNAAKVWGLDKEKVEVLDYKVRRFTERRQDILDDLIKIRERIQPDLVFTPSTNDVHQDHQAVTREVLRAFKSKNTTVLGYELVWNNFDPTTNAFIEVKKEDVDTKLKVLEQYETQKYRAYLNEEFIRGLAKVRGVQIGVDFAEAFEVIKLVM